MIWLKKIDRYRFSLSLEFNLPKKRRVQLSIINQYELEQKNVTAI
jgi:hypothetical protein